MEFIKQAFEMFLHLDKTLADVIRDYSNWTYLLLFAVVFCETGFVVTPFLPGDSLLFAAGTFAGKGDLDVAAVFAVLSLAAILGDSANYWIGGYIGPRILRREDVRFLNRKHLDRTHAFYEKHGGKTIIIARFVPVIRTFAPFVAGIAGMHYPRFLAYNIGGALLWVSTLVFAGYFFGGLSIVKNNFTAVIMAIIVVSILPGVFEYMRQRRQAKKQSPAAEKPGL
jgi:membrane-associated protein